MCKLALIIFIITAIGVGLWAIIRSQDSDPSEFVSSTTPTTMDIVNDEDGSANSQYITITITSITIFYCFLSIVSGSRIKTVTFRADLEEIVEDIEDGFEDDSEPAERCVPEMLFHNSPRVHFDDDWEDEFDEDCEEELDEDDKEEFDEDEEESNSILEDVVERSTENLHVQE
ncbi:hypothetical protein L3Y34_010766 [Caenorhabditis briggsae]|uniref:Transmembrane protein n=1 Tax=Caenorhabditis briggsae TaxID=6238 RepID=A0AAE8ZUJ6_CAEBR|nr:hypothetical protein L3Y34_010766 [Caenorhabditis briggsae]